VVVKITPKRRVATPAETKEREPLFLWWMPLAGILLAAGWAFWEAIDASGNALSAFAEALFWPGIAIFVAATFVVWLAWKVDLE
jgi:hypothetical protein